MQHKVTKKGNECEHDLYQVYFEISILIPGIEISRCSKCGDEFIKDNKRFSSAY